MGRILQKYVSSWHSTVMSEAHVPVQTVQSRHGEETAMEIQKEIGAEVLDKRVPSLKGIRSLKPSNKNFLMYDHEQLESGKKRAQNLIHQIANQLQERESSYVSTIGQECNARAAQAQRRQSLYRSAQRSIQKSASGVTTKLNSIVEVSKPQGVDYRAFAESRGPEGSEGKRRSGPLRTFDGRAHVPPLKFPERGGAEFDGVDGI